jgi:hypothetical protein
MPSRFAMGSAWANIAWRGPAGGWGGRDELRQPPSQSGMGPLQLVEVGGWGLFAQDGDLIADV